MLVSILLGAMGSGLAIWYASARVCACTRKCSRTHPRYSRISGDTSTMDFKMLRGCDRMSKQGGLSLTASVRVTKAQAKLSLTLMAPYEDLPTSFVSSSGSLKVKEKHDSFCNTW